MSRIDHVAYRTADKKKTAKFLMDTLGYKIQKEFTIPFDDGTFAECIALEPPEKIMPGAPWKLDKPYNIGTALAGEPITVTQEYHMPPEIFVSDGKPGSIVGDWVIAKGGIGGIHHIAYQVDSVTETVKEWKSKGFAEFSSEEPMRCPEDNLVQIFTKPIDALGGIILEFIERGEHGFCVNNVKNLMISTAENKK